MMNQSDHYLLAFLARDRLIERTGERRRSEPVLREREPFGGLRELMRGPEATNR